MERKIQGILHSYTAHIAPLPNTKRTPDATPDEESTAADTRHMKDHSTK
jgi:hypothetical protein